MGVTAYLVVLVFQYDDEVLHPSKSQPIQWISLDGDVIL